MKNEKKYFYCVGKKWFDKVNGNTYFNTKVTDKDGRIVFYTGYQYGYGEQYYHEAKKQLEKIIDPAGYDRENWVLIDMGCSYDLKRVLKNNEF